MKESIEVVASLPCLLVSKFNSNHPLQLRSLVDHIDQIHIDNVNRSGFSVVLLKRQNTWQAHVAEDWAVRELQRDPAQYRRYKTAIQSVEDYMILQGINLVKSTRLP